MNIWNKASLVPRLQLRRAGSDASSGRPWNKAIKADYSLHNSLFSKRLICCQACCIRSIYKFSRNSRAVAIAVTKYRFDMINIYACVKFITRNARVFICIGNSMHVSSAICKKHARASFSKTIKIEIFEKLTSVCFFKLHEKPYHYLLIIQFT